MKKLLKAVTIGDIKGIGIEILIKLWKTKRKTIGNFVLITNYNLLIKYLNVKKINWLKKFVLKVKIIFVSSILIFSKEITTTFFFF